VTYWSELDTVVIHTDASLWGWGACLNGKWARGEWSKKDSIHKINWKETMAVLLVLKSFKKIINGRRVRMYIDSTTAISYVKKEGGRFVHLYEVERKISYFCLKNQILLERPTYIELVQNPADLPSQVIDKHNWEVRDQIFEKLNQKWGEFTVDRFASENTRKIKRFNSWHLSPNTEAADAFSVPWKGENNWVVLLFALVMRTLKKLEREKAKGILIAPMWLHKCLVAKSPEIGHTRFGNWHRNGCAEARRRSEETSVQESFMEVRGGSDPTGSPITKTIKLLASFTWADSTKRVYMGQWKWFKKFCISEGRLYLPASTETIIRAIGKRVLDRAPSVANTMLVVISHMHEMSGFDNPCNQKVVALLRKAAKAATVHRKKLGVIWPVDFKKWCVAAKSDKMFLRNRCKITLGIRMIKRTEDLSTINCRSIIFPDDLETGFIKIHVEVTKTERLGMDVYLEPSLDKLVGVTTALVEYVKWRKMNNTWKKKLPLFVKENSTERMSSTVLGEVVVRMGKRVGLPRITGRSLRVTGCTLMSAAGIPENIIKNIGGWKSDCINVYLCGLASLNQDISKKMGFTNQISGLLL